MKPLAYSVIADENIHPDVIHALADNGIAIVSVWDLRLNGCDDETILRAAHSQGRVVLTHDRDFGKLAIQSGTPFTGIIFVRPGHITPTYVLDALLTMNHADIDAHAPFILVVERRGDTVRARLR